MDFREIDCFITTMSDNQIQLLPPPLMFSDIKDKFSGTLFGGCLPEEVEDIILRFLCELYRADIKLDLKTIFWYPEIKEDNHDINHFNFGWKLENHKRQRALCRKLQPLVRRMTNTDLTCNSESNNIGGGNTQHTKVGSARVIYTCNPALFSRTIYNNRNSKGHMRYVKERKPYTNLMWLSVRMGHHTEEKMAYEGPNWIYQFRGQKDQPSAVIKTRSPILGLINYRHSRKHLIQMCKELLPPGWHCLNSHRLKKMTKQEISRVLINNIP